MLHERPPTLRGVDSRDEVPGAGVARQPVKLVRLGMPLATLLTDMFANNLPCIHNDLRRFSSGFAQNLLQHYCTPGVSPNTVTTGIPPIFKRPPPPPPRQQQ